MILSRKRVMFYAKSNTKLKEPSALGGCGEHPSVVKLGQAPSFVRRWRLKLLPYNLLNVNVFVFVTCF